MSVEKVIELKKVTKNYKEVTAVNKLDLSIYKGEIYGLLGPNGAGKSTTIYMILGLTEPTEGEVMVCGLESTRHQMEIKKRVGFMPDDVGFYDNMTGLENLIYIGKLNGLSKKDAEERAKHLLKQVGLEEAMNKKAGKYSRGMRQRLGLADTLMKNPDIVIMDEPTLGIDPKGINEFLEMIQTLSKEQGITVLLSSHQLYQVQQICDRVGIFVKGQLLAEGNINSLQEKLLDVDANVYQVQIEGSEKEFMEKMHAWSKVKKLKKEENGYLVTLHEEDKGELAEFILDNKFKLLDLRRQTFGLDEIYQRYFQGGDPGNAS
jgi:ABC-2 type transport system ATP-binding protein